MTRLIESVEVPRPVTDAFAYTSDFGNIEQWDPGVSRSVRMTPGPVRVGSRYRLDVVFGPSTTVMEYVVTVLEPLRRVVLEGHGGSVHAVDDIRFEPTPTGTRIDYTADLSFDGLTGLVEPLMGPLLRRVGERALQGLRRALSEPPAPPEPSWLTYGLDFLVLPGLLRFTRCGHRMRRASFGPLAESMRGRTVVITGATSGLGRAAAGELARLGARVVLVGRDPGKLTRAREEIRAATGNGDLAEQVADLSRLSEVRALADRLLASEPRIHVLVHNAGVLENERIETGDGIERSLVTNLLAPFLLTRRLAPRLVQSAPSRIVNVLSGGMYLAGLGSSVVDDPSQPWDGASAYARHKRALMVLTEVWAEELAPGGITVHAMHPGWAETPGVVRSLPGFHRVTRPWLRTPEEGADTIVWLAAAPEVARTTGGFWLDRERHPSVVLPWTAPSANQRAMLVAELAALTANAAAAAPADGVEPLPRRRAPARKPARPRTARALRTPEPCCRSCRGGQGVAPAQASKAREVAVGRHEFAPVLDGQGGDVGVGHQRPLDVTAQPGEELPVPAARRDERGAGPVHQVLAERESHLYRRGRIEDPWIGDDAEEARENDVRQGEWLT